MRVRTKPVGSCKDAGLVFDRKCWACGRRVRVFPNAVRAAEWRAMKPANYDVCWLCVARALIAIGFKRNGVKTPEQAMAPDGEWRKHAERVAAEEAAAGMEYHVDQD